MKKNFFSSFMRSRILAIIILLILIGVPVFIWWIFFQKSTSYIVVNLNTENPVNIRLKGTFSNSFFPIVDSILNFSKECIQTCTFGPIAPVKYSLSIFSDNFVDFSDEIILKKGETIEKNYILTQKINYDFLDDFEIENQDQKKNIENEIHQKNPNLTYIGTDLLDRKWVFSLQNSTTSIGFLKGDNFINLKNFSQIFDKIEFFKENNSFILYDYSGSEAILADIDFENILKIKISENQKIQNIFYDKNWFILENGILKEYKNLDFVENIRFSNFRDIDNFRIGYISKNDEKRLKMSNYDVDMGSVLLLLNRQNGDFYQIARGLDIGNIFIFEDNFVFENNGKFYKINPQKIGL